MNIDDKYSTAHKAMNHLTPQQQSLIQIANCQLSSSYIPTYTVLSTSYIISNHTSRGAIISACVYTRSIYIYIYICVGVGNILGYINIMNNNEPMSQWK